MLYQGALAAFRRCPYLSGEVIRSPAISPRSADGNAQRPGRPRKRTTFDKREEVFEDEYKHDQELQCKVEGRRNKRRGLWVAELLGLSGADAEAYAKEVVKADFEEPGDADVIRKIQGDAAPKNLDLSEHRIRKKMEEMTVVAKEQIMTE